MFGLKTAVRVLDEKTLCILSRTYDVPEVHIQIFILFLHDVNRNIKLTWPKLAAWCVRIYMEQTDHNLTESDLSLTRL